MLLAAVPDWLTTGSEATVDGLPIRGGDLRGVDALLLDRLDKIHYGTATAWRIDVQEKLGARCDPDDPLSAFTRTDCLQHAQLPSRIAVFVGLRPDPAKHATWSEQRNPFALIDVPHLERPTEAQIHVHTPRNEDQ